nr:immunoglobulin light chain junction region [Macaca mulatta]MOW66389.1 immunoglobulin light chain junction region [Macaca mulatta]MOW66585.1 immunoglobulin light chain junction region [Macaca mulatta]MOW66763.1 immunoglobulin light chain junction region [Macaca mulatta]MOW66846.1 immunoglobulin light chain junction region [Macaca mulatta]
DYYCSSYRSGNILLF